jgi:hypothetical protein
MFDFLFNWVLGWHWSVYVIIGLAIASLVRYLTGSWQATFLILATAGAAAGVARARQAGADYEKRKMAKRNAEFKDESQKIDREVKKTPRAKRDKLSGRFVRDDR